MHHPSATSGDVLSIKNGVASGELHAPRADKQMIEATAPHVAEEERSVRSRATGADAHGMLLAYLLVLMGLPALFLLSSIFIVRSPSFPLEAGDPFLLKLDYPYSLRNADCTILIYGDSTAITGIDPTVVGQATGMKTCNISQSQSILEIVGPRALEIYLAHNKPPKYLVVQLAPETLSRRRQTLFWPEGLTVLVRRRSLPVALFTMVQHPVETYDFALWAIKAKYAALRHQSPDFSRTEAVFESHQGLLMLPKAPETHCSRNVAFWPPSAEYVDQFRQRFGKNGTQVLVLISPIPECAPNAQMIADSLKGVTDNSLPLYPIDLFCDLDRHLTLDGAKRASEEIARKIMGSSHAASVSSSLE